MGTVSMEDGAAQISATAQNAVYMQLLGNEILIPRDGHRLQTQTTLLKSNSYTLTS